ncbi:unnamed protein product [Rotaria sp. Silwood1]|nr:unnamed protein product [Rotaria sp. Silwood1]
MTDDEKRLMIERNAVPFGGTVMTTGLFVNEYSAIVAFEAPNIIICSIAEYEATIPSTELQAYKNMNANYGLY